MNLVETYSKLIHKVPSYAHGTSKVCRKKIQAIMRETEHDEDYVEEISDEFCQGFGVARGIMLELIREELENNKKADVTDT